MLKIDLGPIPVLNYLKDFYPKVKTPPEEKKVYSAFLVHIHMETRISLLTRVFHPWSDPRAKKILQSFLRSPSEVALSDDEENVPWGSGVLPSPKIEHKAN